MSTQTSLPTLYQRTATGAIQTWFIEGGEDEQAGDGRGYLLVRHGQLHGKLQEAVEPILRGKNVGKANFTSPAQQAMKEAESKWRKKRDREGYVEDLARAQAGERDQAGVAPMLAEVVDKINPEKLEYPAHLQVKFDGNRVIQRRQAGVTKLFSRKQKPIFSVPHIAEAWDVALAGFREDIDLDGEGYRHGWKLQKISGFFRSDAPKDGYLELGHFVYDVPSHDGTWEERQQYLARLFQDTVFPNLARDGRRQTEVLAWLPKEVSGLAEDQPAVYGVYPIYYVQSFHVGSLAEGWKLADYFASLRFEGGIMRQLRARYEFDRRSGVLAKLKRYKDAEFEIVGCHPGRGKWAECAVFECVTDKGVHFDCAAPGELEDKKRCLQEAAKYVGKKLSVRYFGWSEDNKPLQPTPIAVRDYE